MVVVVTFPIFVLEQDSGDVGRFDSVEELQHQLERIDVENSEYAAWDSAGQSLQLMVEEPFWLVVRPGEDRSDTELTSALLRIADRAGISLVERAPSTIDPGTLFDWIVRHRTSAARPGGFLGR